MGQDSAREARGQASAVTLERTVSHALFEALIILSAFIAALDKPRTLLPRRGFAVRPIGSTLVSTASRR
jgi:hypothetical protein